MNRFGNKDTAAPIGRPNLSKILPSLLVPEPAPPRKISGSPSTNPCPPPPPPGGPPALSPDCNLAVGRRVSIPTVEGDLTTAYGSMTLLLPKGTDIRDASCVASLAGDLVEVPAGSGRFYFVAYVDDVGKGFLNEHRYAYISKACQASDPTLFSYIWPAPIP